MCFCWRRIEVLLHRYSGQDDILIGLTMAVVGPPLQHVIGYFTAPVVAHADFSSKPTFAQLLSQVRQQVFYGPGASGLPVCPVG